MTRRPLALVRCPSGIESECFFQKHAWNGMSKAIRRRTIGDEEILFIEDLEGPMAPRAIELPGDPPVGLDAAGREARPDHHGSGSRRGCSPDGADRGCLEVRERLNAVGLESFVKTTGGKGLHVVVPLAPKAGWEEVKAFAESIAEAMAKDGPERFIATMSKRAHRPHLCRLLAQWTARRPSQPIRPAPGPVRRCRHRWPGTNSRLPSGPVISPSRIPTWLRHVGLDPGPILIEEAGVPGLGARGGRSDDFLVSPADRSRSGLRLTRCRFDAWDASTETGNR